MYDKELNAVDLDIAARTVYGEARGEDFLGKVAVAWVIRNRSTIDLHNDGKPDWWGETIFQVCRKKWQFSCWNTKDPNRAKLLHIPVRDEGYRECLNAVALSMVGVPDKDDPTNGSTHYHVFDMRRPPKWSQGKTPCARIGAHVFYKDIG